MTLAITGWGVVCGAGIGQDAFVSAWNGEAAPPNMPGLTPPAQDALPPIGSHSLVDLNVRAILGRKGTSSLDRRTALTLIACREALLDGEVKVDDSNRPRIGVALGTTWGSLTAMSEYTKESLTEERPYLVDPGRFPNTVMNCAAGQAAIWFGLKGVNVTIAGGRMAVLNAVHYSTNALRCRYADLMLVGGVEEFTPHTAWAHFLTRHASADAIPGEAAVVFVLERAEAANARHHHIGAEILAVATAFVPRDRSAQRLQDALSRCIRRALSQGGVEPGGISHVVTSDGHERADSLEVAAAADVCGRTVSNSSPGHRFGDCQAAGGALQLATALIWHRSAPDREGHTLLTGRTDEGAVGALVLRGGGL